MARVDLSKVIVTENKEQGIFNDVGLSTFQNFTFVEQFCHSVTRKLWKLFH